VRRTRVYIGVLLLGLGLLGGFLGVAAPESPPWLPPPAKPPLQTRSGAVAPAAVFAPPVSAGAIVPVQALSAVPEEGSLSPPKTSQAGPPGIFPANVVPAQALAPETQPKPGENPPPPNFPEPKAAPPPTLPDAVTGAENGGPMLNPSDDVKPRSAPSSASGVKPPAMPTVPTPAAVPPPAVNLESGPIPLPKLIEQKGSPLPESTVPPAVPHAPSEPERPAQVAIPIGRARAPAPAPAPVTPPATAELVPKRPAIPEPAPVPKLPSPLLTVEKRGPAELQLGEPVRFEIIVRNVGALPATQVRIEDTLPEGVRFLGGSPHPVLEAGRVVWNLPQVLPGQEGKVYLEVQANAAGELTTQTTLSHVVESRMQVRPGSIALSVKAPERAAVGQPVVFEVQLVNTADQPLSQVILNARMSMGLVHRDGRTIKSDPFDLRARGSRTATLTTTALQPGRQSLEVAIIAQGRQQAVAQADVFVGETSLVVHVPATVRIAPGRISDLPIEVGNFDARPARNLIVTSKLPKGLEFHGASDGGVHHAGQVQWAIDYLAPGQTRFLHVRVKTKSPADFTHVVSARAADNMKAQAEGHVLAEGSAQLNLVTSVRDHPLEAGRDTVFEIRLTNDGSSPDTNVQLRALLPEGMAPRSVTTGTTGLKFHLEGTQQVVFDPITQLEPKSQVIVQIGVRAVAAGDRRLRAQVMSNQLRTPVVREERILVYHDDR
jgi:uncharacterized repeat protein (TIGR01451 family)